MKKINDLKRRPTRDGLGDGLAALAACHEDVVVLDADLAPATRTEVFARAYPDRFIQCGIAEGNMLDVAAGLAACGFTPYPSTFAMFAAGRGYEMIRNSIGYPRLNVKICATHGGVSVGEDGASHQMNEDFALMRAIPGMTVLCPADYIEAREMVKAAYDIDGPVYIRFGRAAVPCLHEEGFRFVPGMAEELRPGKDVTIVAAGLMVSEALKAAEILEEDGISAQVLNMATIKPLDQKTLQQAALRTGRIITAEEHSLIGGLSEAVRGCLCGLPLQIASVGMPDVFGHSGPAEYLLHEFGQDAAAIVNRAREMMAESDMAEKAFRDTHGFD